MHSVDNYTHKFAYKGDFCLFAFSKIEQAFKKQLKAFS